MRWWLNGARPAGGTSFRAIAAPDGEGAVMEGQHLRRCTTATGAAEILSILEDVNSAYGSTSTYLRWLIAEMLASSRPSQRTLP